VSSTLKSENRKIKNKKKVTQKVIPQTNKTLTSENADQYHFKERKFSKVFMKFQELPNRVAEPSYNIHHSNSNFKGGGDLKLWCNC